MISRWPRLLSLASGPRYSFLLITMATLGTIVLDIISISHRVLDRQEASQRLLPGHLAPVGLQLKEGDVASLEQHFQFQIMGKQGRAING